MRSFTIDLHGYPVVGVMRTRSSGRITLSGTRSEGSKPWYPGIFNVVLSDFVMSFRIFLVFFVLTSYTNISINCSVSSSRGRSTGAGGTIGSHFSLSLGKYMIGLSDLRRPGFDSFFAIVLGIPIAVADMRHMATSRTTMIFSFFRRDDE